MREIDRIAVARGVPNLYQMMENAGRAMARLVVGNLGRDWRQIPVSVHAGWGGNGGGGIVAARNLANWGGDVALILSGDLAPGSVPAEQLGVYLETPGRLQTEISSEAGLVVDALIGYGLRDAPTGVIADMIEAIRAVRGHVLSLDIPSGIHGDTGEAPGVAVRPDQTLTLALPKTGLGKADVGELWLADLGIPAGTLRRAGVEVPAHLFEDGPLIRLVRRSSQP
jgi:NAD(P)H-hydrate epimerase